jgi:sigma-B regulation protein RsbU (phosphoserine phosphatase)
LYSASATRSPSRKSPRTSPPFSDSPKTANPPPDILIADLFSCGFAGFELQEKIKALGGGTGTRVIIVTPFGEPKCAARAIQLGADDCLGWDVEPSVLLARIESSLERRRLKARRQLYLAAASRARESLEDELRRGAEYVRCLLPGKISGEALSTDWRFIPSASLGGDLFGYHRLPDGRMAIFMIDVSGHGVQSALYSVTIFDVLRGAGLKDVDFGDPASVLKGLNHAFRMEERNNMLFTLWYGVWDDRTRVLSHASAGSPPGVLVLRGGGAVELKAGGMVGGADPEAEYRRLEIQVPRGSRLFLFSDGIYEFFTAGGEMLGLEAFVQLLERAASSAAPGESSVGAVIGEVSALSSNERFQDDLSLLEVRFD